MAAPSKSNTDTEFQLKSRHAGKVRLSLQKMICYDPFGLFPVKTAPSGEVLAFTLVAPESFSLEEGLTTVLERLVENKRAIRNIWASPDRAFYEQNLMRVCNYVVSRYIACRSVDLLRTLPEEELALLVDFCQCELFGQVTNWLNQNMVYDIVAHVQALCRLFEGSIAQALEAAPMEA
ncbi:MAG: hypothetical protein BHV98_05625 [Clostridium sp. CAG:217_53_7]|nr:MAG: hypothetical protein BHV98_05625 [Clostridium sp. CAG:217_53_7]